MDINKLEIEGRIKFYSYDWDASIDKNKRKLTEAAYTSRINDKLNLIIIHQLNSSTFKVQPEINYMNEKALGFFEVENLRPQFGDCLQILAFSCFSGTDENFNYFIKAMKIISEYETEHASQRDYQYYKCLCKIWEGEMDIALEILNNNVSQKGNKKFYLPSSEAAIRSMLDKNEDLFIELIENMRDEHAKKHKNIRFLNQSFAMGVVAYPAMALLKVSEKYFCKDIAEKISPKQHTFKFLPRFIDDVDLDARGEFTIDHMFPLKFWPCNQC